MAGYHLSQFWYPQSIAKSNVNNEIEKAKTGNQVGVFI
jgi:hypothetical protein